MFHSRQFCALVMSPFFHRHEPFGDITLDDIRPPFRLPRYPIDEESDPSELTYPTYSVEPDPLEPSYLSVIRLSSYSSTSFAASQAPPPVRGRGFICTCTVAHSCGCAWGGGCGDNAPGGFGNEYLPFD